LLVLAVYSLKGIQRTNLLKSYRSFNHVSEQEFLKGLQGMDFNNISKDEDLDEAYPKFENSSFIKICFY
jgi:hypothetical protein